MLADCPGRSSVVNPVGSVTLGGRLGDLLIEAELGRGAFATVYRAQDTLLQRTVAVKVLHDLEQHSGSEAARRMLREARLVGGLTSPHIVTLYRVHTFGTDTCVFELEFMDGGSLEERLAGGALPVEEARRVFLGILGALRTAHERQVLHRDVKPANVLLGRDGAVKLTDFGLGRLLGDQHLSSQGAARLVGTPSYMAPEVISGAEATPASDLWGAGVVLYRMLAGRLPFEARTLPALFLALSEGTPTPLPEGLPPDLASACMECLRHSPAQRPVSGAALLARLETGSTRTSTRGLRAEPVVPEAPRRAALVGRAQELARIDEALARLDAGQPAAILLPGGAGSGKTTLLREVVERGRARGFACVEVVLTPAGGLQRPLLQSMRRVLGVEGDAQALSRVTDVRFGAAAPLLRDVLASQAPPDLQNSERRVWALESLLAGLAREGPVVLAVDDLHLADADDLRLLLDLRRHLADVPVLLAFALRTGDPDASTETSPLLLRLQQEVAAQPGAVVLPLGRLPDDAIYEIVQAQATGGPLEAGVADLLVRKADGNPLHALELFRHLTATGDVAPREGKLRFREGWVDAGLPPRLRDVMAARLGLLSDDDRGLLDIAAVDGVPIDGQALAGVLERPLLRVLQGLQRLSRQHGLVQPDREGFRFANALYRDVIYRDLAPDLRRELHRLLAEHLERRQDPAGVQPERLGSHWEEAGLPERAQAPLLRAAAEALSRQENLRATDLARRAGLGPDLSDHVLIRSQADLVAGLSGACFDLGRHAVAESYVRALGDAARAVGDEPLALRAAVLENDLAYAARGAKAMDTERLRRAVEVLPGGREQALACYSLAREAVIARGDEQAGERWLEQAERVCVAHRLRGLQASVIDFRGRLAFGRGRMHEAEALYAESARICRQEGRRTNAAISEVNAIDSRFERGDLEGLAPPLEEAIRTFSRAGFDVRTAHCHVHMSRLRYACGEPERALIELNLAQDILSRTPSASTQAYALRELAHLRLVRGELGEAERVLDRLEHVATQAGQHFEELRCATFRAQWLDLAGEPERARAQVERTLLRAGQAAEAIVQVDVAVRLAECLLLGLRGVSASGLRSLLPAVVEVSDTRAMRALSLIEAAEALSENDGPAAPLRAAAGQLVDAPLGYRREEHRAFGHLLAGEAARRAGDVAGHRSEMAAALEGSRRLGHVWLELVALSALERDGNAGDLRGRRSELLTRVGDALPDDHARGRLRARWGAAG